MGEEHDGHRLTRLGQRSTTLGGDGYAVPVGEDPTRKEAPKRRRRRGADKRGGEAGARKSHVQCTALVRLGRVEPAADDLCAIHLRFEVDNADRVLAEQSADHGERRGDQEGDGEENQGNAHRPQSDHESDAASVSRQELPAHEGGGHSRVRTQPS